MSRGSWHEGRRAWERLSGWSEERGHPDDGDAALEALSDVGDIRRLLDQAELVAVRTARLHGRPWAEIATRLGVTRQSAWEKWRELDDTPEAAASTIDALFDRAAEAVVTRTTGRRGRAGKRAVVPDVIGLTWDDARTVLMRAQLVAVGPDPDGPPLAALGWPGGVVVDQAPKGGAVLPPGSTVTLWLDRGGGAGDREPRHPRPTPKHAIDIPLELNEDVLPDPLTGEAFTPRG